jgi:hypothetical protein
LKTAIYLPFFYFFWINQTDISRYFCSPGCCYSMLMKDAHRCVERAMHHNCPVCFEVNKALIQCNTYVSKILKSFLILREVFFFFFHTVSIWHYERYHCVALWTHNTFGMLERDGTTLPVSTMHLAQIHACLQHFLCTFILLHPL